MSPLSFHFFAWPSRNKIFIFFFFLIKRGNGVSLKTKNVRQFFPNTYRLCRAFISTPNAHVISKPNKTKEASPTRSTWINTRTSTNDLKCQIYFIFFFRETLYLTKRNQFECSHQLKFNLRCARRIRNAMIDRSASIFLFSLIFFFFFLQHHHWKGERATWCRRSHCLSWRVYLLRAAKNAKGKEAGQRFSFFFFIAHKKRKKKRRADSWQNLIFFCWKTHFFIFFIFTIVWQNGASKCNTRSGSKRPFLFFSLFIYSTILSFLGLLTVSKRHSLLLPPPSLYLSIRSVNKPNKQEKKRYISHYIYLFIDFYLPPRNSLMFCNAEGSVIEKRIANISPPHFIICVNLLLLSS